MSTRLRHSLSALLGLLFLALAPAASASANVDDFSYASWTSEYEITIDEDGRSHAHVTETLVARFPDHDQNRGIVRGLLQRYEGASLDTRILAVTDEHGDPVPYETESEDGTLYLLLGDDEYQRGLTTYVIEYTMRDVILAATQSGNDEFYWNMLPARSTQPIERFDAGVTFSPELSDALTLDSACYEGYYGSTMRCELAVEELGDGRTRYTVASADLPAGYGVTVAIGLRPAEVAQPPARTPNPVTDAAPFALAGAGALTAVGGGIAAASFRRRRRTATGIVIAQYDVPDRLPPLLAAAVYPGARDAVPAEIVHLAVRGILRIEETGEKKARPQLRLLDDRSEPDPLDGRMRDALFRGVAVGEVFELPKSSEKFAKRMQKVQAAGTEEATKRGLLTRERSPLARTLLWVTLSLSALAPLLALFGAIRGREAAIAALVTSLIVGVVACIVAGVGAARHRVHTPAGAEANEYLQGVREFVRVAETDRLRMLQSHHGAERYHEGSTEIVHLYERLLPYAMLFGEEKSWGRVLEVAYQTAQTAPVWMGPYYAGGLSSQLSSFSSSAQASSTYSSSSSSGGSTGGGFSGGGGGGGFSGGR